MRRRLELRVAEVEHPQRRIANGRNINMCYDLEALFYSKKLTLTFE